VDLVVAIGADQKEVLNVRLGQQTLEQVQCRCVQPLQVVEEERQRMARFCEDADEAAEYELEPPLRLLRLKLRHWRLFSDNECQFGDETGDQPAIQPERF